MTFELSGLEHGSKFRSHYSSWCFVTVNRVFVFCLTISSVNLHTPWPSRLCTTLDTPNWNKASCFVFRYPVAICDVSLRLADEVFASFSIVTMCYVVFLVQCSSAWPSYLTSDTWGGGLLPIHDRERDAYTVSCETTTLFLHTLPEDFLGGSTWQYYLYIRPRHDLFFWNSCQNVLNFTPMTHKMFVRTFQIQRTVPSRQSN